MDIVGDKQQLCEGRDFLGNVQEGDKKQGVTSVHDRDETAVVPGAAQVVSVRHIAADIRDGLIVLVIGFWVVTLGGEGPTSKMADLVEGWLIGRSRRVPSGPALFSLQLRNARKVLDGDRWVGVADVAIELLNEPEAAVLVEELHRALGALERLGEGDPCEGGDERDPDDRDDGVADTEPAPPPSLDELELGRGAGGLLALDEVCS